MAAVIGVPGMLMPRRHCVTGMSVLLVIVFVDRLVHQQGRFGSVSCSLNRSALFSWNCIIPLVLRMIFRMLVIFLVSVTHIFNGV